MDITAKFVNELNVLFEANKTIIEDANVDSINVKTFEAREVLINQLNTLLGFIPVLTHRVSDMLIQTGKTHSKELTAMNTLLNKLKPKQPEANKTIPDVKPSELSDEGSNAWITIARKRQDTIRKIKIMPPVSTQTPATMTSYSRVKFTEALSLPAIKVPTFDYVKSDGELYYVESADHFAFKLAGKLLHGNIGMIYTEEKNPEKIKDCKFATSCMKHDRCDYYHDPYKFPGSKDHRNFIASSFLYSPPNSDYKNRPRSRRFGSREHLDKDIVGLGEEEISRFHDQTMHDLLCTMLLNSAYSQTQN